MPIPLNSSYVFGMRKRGMGDKVTNIGYLEYENRMQHLLKSYNTGPCTTVVVYFSRDRGCNATGLKVKHGLEVEA